MASLLDEALRHDLDLCLNPYSIEVHVYDMALSETFTFTEHVNFRHERRAALKRCLEKAIKKAKSLKETP